MSANGIHALNGCTPANRIAGAADDLNPPHDIEVERGILGAIVEDREHLATVRAILEPGDFYRESHQLLYRAILDLDAAGGCDGVLLWRHLEDAGLSARVGGFDGFLEITRRPNYLFPDRYAALVRDLSRRRQLLVLANELRLGVAAGTESAELLDRFVGRAEALRVDRPGAAEPAVRSWPDPPEAAAFTGPAGEVVRLIRPHTEADPAAILVQFLVAFGSLVGRNPFWWVESTRHGLNLFACVVGSSSKARKGTSWDHVRRLLAGADPYWGSDCVQHGLSSGEGLIHAIRDARGEDPGVADKRLLAVETEFGATLSILGRDGNTLSGQLRQAWDGNTLRAMTKNSPGRATDPHVSVIGHVTVEDLERQLSRTDAANGFANRFLWVCARRSQYLPHGGKVHQVDFAGVHRQLRAAAEHAQQKDFCLVRDDEANRTWETVYPILSEPRPGLLGSVTSRAEAQVMRLACLYALLECSNYVRAAHLHAALALWAYCEESAAYVFGDALGDPDAERLLAALAEAGPAGLTRSRITAGVFGGHLKAEELNKVLGRLERSGLAYRVPVATAGRTAEVWVAGRIPAKEAREAKEAPG